MDEFEAIVQQQTEIDRRFFREAYKYAIKHSEDPMTATGAVAVKNGMVIVKGANKAPNRVIITPEMMMGPNKYSYLGHAEENIITGSAMMGIPLINSTMYTPRFPCAAPCMRGIINAGFSEVVTHKELQELCADLEPEWVETQKIAAEMMNLAGLRHREVSCKIGNDIPIKVRGKIYYL